MRTGEGAGRALQYLRGHGEPYRGFPEAESQEGLTFQKALLDSSLERADKTTGWRYSCRGASGERC